MKTFEAYISENASDRKLRPAKWSPDKKTPGQILLKSKNKVLYKMYKSTSDSVNPYHVDMLCGVNVCRTFKDAMKFVDHMLTTANFGLYDVAPIDRKTVDWIES